MRHRSHPLLLRLGLVLACALPTLSARAEAQATPGSALPAPPIYDLADQTVEERLQVEKVQLAHQSLRGPANEVIWGSVFLTWAPIMAGFVQLISEPPLLDCFGDSGAEADACEARDRRQERRAFRNGLMVGAGMAVVGLGMIAHGTVRIRAVRAARREVRLSRFNLALEQGGAQMQLGVSF